MLLPTRRSRAPKVLILAAVLVLCFLLFQAGPWRGGDFYTSVHRFSSKTLPLPVTSSSAETLEPTTALPTNDLPAIALPTTSLLVAPEPTPSLPTTPLPTTPSLPPKLWYKLGPNGLNPELQEWVHTCTSKNPTFTAMLMTDASGDAFVNEHYADRPDIVEAYHAIQVPIVKADLLRYLLLYAEGGVWNDLDVSCQVPISEWIPSEYLSRTNIVVGLEFDKGWADNIVRQFASWTILAKPRSPHMLMVIEDILASLQDKVREHNVPISGLSREMVGEIVDFSGPRRLTVSIVKSLNANLEEDVGDASIKDVVEPRLVGDVLMLPGYAFANSSNQWDGYPQDKVLLVEHHYAGTWKNAHGGEDLIVKSETSR